MWERGGWGGEEGRDTIKSSQQYSNVGCVRKGEEEKEGMGGGGGGREGEEEGGRGEKENK